MNYDWDWFSTFDDRHCPELVKYKYPRVSAVSPERNESGNEESVTRGKYIQKWTKAHLLK